MNKQPKIPIATIGLEKAHLGILEFLISYYFQEDFFLTKHRGEDEQVCIFHIKSDNDYKDLINHKEQNPAILFIAITRNKINDKSIESITFPLSPRKISDVLHKIKEKINKEPILTQDNIKKTQIKKIKKTYNKKNKETIIAPIEKNIPNKALNNNKEKTSITSVESRTPNKISDNNKEKTSIKSIESRTPNKIPDDNKEKISIKSVENRTPNEIPDNNKEKTSIRSVENNIPNKALDHKKPEPKINIDDLHETINKMQLNPLPNNLAAFSRHSTKPKTKKTTTIKNKAENNKNKQISIKKDNLKFAASRSDINLNNPTIVASLVYPTNKYLQGELTRLYTKAKNEGEIITLDTSYGIISYNPKNHKAFVSVNNTTLQNISSIANLKGKYLSQPTNNISDKNWECADALLWKITIWASRGRLPVGADIDAPFVLKHWPNLTRFMMTPHAMEITALWIHEPTTLRKTITLLAIPQRTVFSFYSAVIALQLVIISPVKTPKNAPKNEKVQQITSKPAKKKRKGFFGKLLNYFKPDNIEEI